VAIVARIKQPQVPPGALNDFFSSLHDLHVKAGQPSIREIQRDIGRDSVSHTTIHKAFIGPRIPGWIIVEQLVEALADRSRQERIAIIEQFKSLWEAAARSPQDGSGADTEKIRSVAQAVRETIQQQPARSYAELMIGTLDEIEAVSTRVIGRELVPTGFSDVDALTSGMRPGSLIVIGAEPSIGKSILLITICAKSALSFGLPTAIFSNEMTERDIQVRILSAESRVPHHSVRSGAMTEDQWAQLARRMGEAVDAPLWLSYSPCLSISDLEEKAKSLSDERSLRLLAIDNIDAVIAAHEPELVLYRLKEVAAELHIPILMTANMRKRSKVKSYERADTSQLWHAEAIESIADMLIILNREDAYEPETPRAGEIDLAFVKNRHGPTATVTLAFQAHYSRVVDLFISNERRVDWSFKTAENATDE
jgi:replicative DNA helicase